MVIHTMVLLRVTAITNNIRQAEFTVTIWRLDADDDDDDHDLDDLYKKKNKKKKNGRSKKQDFFAREKEKNLPPWNAPCSSRSFFW